MSETVETNGAVVPPAAAAPSPAPEAPAPAPPSDPPPKAPSPDWKEARIARLTGQLREAQERLRVAETKPPAPSALPPVVPAAEVDARAEALAKELEAQRDFNRRCDETAQAGRKSFGEAEFNSRVQDLVKIFDRNDPAQATAYNLLLDAAMSTGKGHEIVHKLGGDLNEASRLLSLPPIRMAMEIAKMASPPPAAPISQAPKPITPIGNAGLSNTPISPDDPERGGTLTTEDWMRRREAQVRERAQARM